MGYKFLIWTQSNKSKLYNLKSWLIITPLLFYSLPFLNVVICFWICFSDFFHYDKLLLESRVIFLIHFVYNIVDAYFLYIIYIQLYNIYTLLYNICILDNNVYECGYIIYTIFIVCTELYTIINNDIYINIIYIIFQNYFWCMVHYYKIPYKWSEP